MPQLQLREDSPQSSYLLFAVMTHPSVTAAFHEWYAAVAAMAREAAAASEVAYHEYMSAVFGVATQTRRAWVELAFLGEAIHLREASVVAIDQSLALAGAQFSTGQGMVTLETQVRLLNEADRIRAELATLRDRRTAAQARLKSALGLSPEAAGPPWPRGALEASVSPAEQELWLRAQAANPEVATMRAMVEMALQGVDVARRSGTPDVAIGAMVDLRAAPLMVRPVATVSLPVWRERIAAVIDMAKARRDAATARLAAAQLELAAELAQTLYMVREAERMIAYIDETALPNLKRQAASAEAAYQSGMGSAMMIPETRLMMLTMDLERLEALRLRELALADLALLIADAAPPGALAGRSCRSPSPPNSFTHAACTLRSSRRSLATARSVA